MKRAINQVINQIRYPLSAPSPAFPRPDDRFVLDDFWTTCPIHCPAHFSGQLASVFHRLFPWLFPGGVALVSLAANYAARRGHRSKIRMQEQLGRIPICGSYFLQSSIWSLICLAFPLFHFPIFLFFFFDFVWPVLILGCNVCIWDFRPRKKGAVNSLYMLNWATMMDGWIWVVDFGYIYVYIDAGAISRLNMTDEPCPPNFDSRSCVSICIQSVIQIDLKRWKRFT